MKSDILIEADRDTLFLIHPRHLRHHPDNMRDGYPQEDVETMAASIKANGGNVQPMVAMVSPSGEHLWTVQGNLRLEGAWLLGDKTPLLSVMVREYEDRAAAMLAMTSENVVRFDVDPIAEGRHYRNLIDIGDLSRSEISRRTGASLVRINDRLRLLKFGRELRRLIAERKLPRGRKPVEALLSIEDQEVRIQTAMKLASRNAGVAMVVQTCKYVVGQLRYAAWKEENELARAAAKAFDGEPMPDPSAAITRPRFRAAVHEVCKDCEVIEGLTDCPEPGWVAGWDDMLQAAGYTCAQCPPAMGEICAECPLTQFIKALRVSQETG